MPSVVIAGGTSPSLGRSLTTSIILHAPTWHPIILSRIASPSSTTPASAPSWLTPHLATSRATLLHVNYASPASLISALQGAHTVISVLGFTPTSSSTSTQDDEQSSWFTTQINLLNAAVAAGVQRFAPSEFGVGVLATPRIDALRGNLVVWRACEESGIEWTRFECGLFMNYLGFGVPEGGAGGGVGRREEALGGREGDGEWFFVSSECRAELPVRADGGFPRVSLTAVEDVGRFVARSLELPDGAWETTSYMVGETVSVDAVVRIAENVMGEKWAVKTVGPEEWEERIEGLGEERDAERKLWAQLGLCYTRDAEGEGWLDGRLNRLFPDVKPLTVEAYLRKYYN